MKKRKKDRVKMRLLVLGGIFLIFLFGIVYGLYINKPKITIKESICEEREIIEEKILRPYERIVLNEEQLKNYQNHSITEIIDFDVYFFLEGVCWDVVSEIHPEAIVWERDVNFKGNYGDSPYDVIDLERLICPYYFEKFVEIQGQEELIEYGWDELILRDIKLDNPKFNEENITLKERISKRISGEWLDKCSVKIPDSDLIIALEGGEEIAELQLAGQIINNSECLKVPKEIEESWAEIRNDNLYYDVGVEVNYGKEKVCHKEETDKIPYLIAKTMYEDGRIDWDFCYGNACNVSGQMYDFGFVEKKNIDIKWLNTNCDKLEPLPEGFEALYSCGLGYVVEVK